MWFTRIFYLLFSISKTEMVMVLEYTFIKSSGVRGGFFSFFMIVINLYFRAVLYLQKKIYWEFLYNHSKLLLSNSGLVGFFSFYILSLHSLVHKRKVSEEKSNVIHIFVPLYIRLFSSAPFATLSLIFCSLNMSLVVDIFIFILICILWDSWICCVVSAINCGNFWQYCYNYFFYLFPPSSILIIPFITIQ